MVLDPMTGEMVPAEVDPDEDDEMPTVLNEKKNVVIKLGQLSSKHGSEKSTQVCVLIHNLFNSTVTTFLGAKQSRHRADGS